MSSLMLWRLLLGLATRQVIAPLRGTKQGTHKTKAKRSDLTEKTQTAQETNQRKPPQDGLAGEAA